ncbi:type III secretion system export apparatus subunit SctT [Brucella sp. LJL56]
MTSSSGIFSALHQVHVVVFVAALAMARMVGLMILMALFTRARIAGLLRNGVAIALSIPLMPLVYKTVVDTNMGPTTMVALGMKEMFLGATLGFVMSLPFWAAEAAGDIVDLQRGVTMGSLIDPMMTHETSITGTLFSIVMIVIFLSLGGLLLMLDIVYTSYRIWPVDQFTPVFRTESVTLFLNLCTRIVTMALALAFPLIVGLLLSDILLALVSRAAPHLNIFAMSLAVKSLSFTVLLLLYAAFLLTYLKGELSFFGEINGLLEGLVDVR